MADSLEFSSCRHDFDLPPGLAHLGAAARFRRTGCQVQAITSDVLCDPILAAGICLEFPAESVPEPLPGTSVRVRNTEFRPVVLRATHWSWPYAGWWHHRADCSLRCFPARTAHMVALGNCGDDYLFGRARLHRAGLYRATLQYLQTDNELTNQRSDPRDGSGQSNSGEASF